MYKKFIELKNWYRIWIQEQWDEKDVEIILKNLKWEIIFHSNPCKLKESIKIIEILIKKNEIFDEIETYHE